MTIRDGTVLAHPGKCPKCGEEKDIRSALCRVCRLRADLREALSLRELRKKHAAETEAWRASHRRKAK